MYLCITIHVYASTDKRELLHALCLHERSLVCPYTRAILSLYKHVSASLLNLQIRTRQFSKLPLVAEKRKNQEEFYANTSCKPEAFLILLDQGLAQLTMDVKGQSSRNFSTHNPRNNLKDLNAEEDEKLVNHFFDKMFFFFLLLLLVLRNKNRKSGTREITSQCEIP